MVRLILAGSRKWQMAVLLVGATFLVRALEIAVTRELRGSLSTVEVVFFRYFLGRLFLFTPVNSDSSGSSGNNDSLWRNKTLFWRNLLGIAATLLLTLALPLTSISVATTLFSLSSLFIVLISIWLVRDHTPLAMIPVALVGLLGVVLVTNPDLITPNGLRFDQLRSVLFSLTNSPASSISLLQRSAPIILIVAAVFAALADIFMQKVMKNGVTSLQIAKTYCVTGAIVMAVLLPFNWTTPTLPQLFLLGVLGPLAAIFQWLFGSSMAYLGAAVMAPWKYSVLVWSQIIDVIFLGLFPTISEGLGMLLIVGASIRAISLSKKG